MIEVTIQSIARKVRKKKYKTGVEVTGFSYPADPNTGNISDDNYAADKELSVE